VNNEDNDFLELLFNNDNDKNDDNNNNNNNITSSTNHIINNFQLFGFSSITLSLIQTLKEMIENSIDAMKSTKNDSKNINIFITQYENHDNLLSISIEDTGIGMSNPLLHLTPFETTKISDKQQQNMYFGRFGVGLSTAFIYSFKHTKAPLVVLTKTHDSIMAKKYSLAFDQSWDIIEISKEYLVVDNVISGTSIHIVVPIIETNCPLYSTSEFDDNINDKDNLPIKVSTWKTNKAENIYEVLDSINEYLIRLDVLSAAGQRCNMTISLDVQVDDLHFEKVYNSEDLYEDNSVISDEHFMSDDVTFLGGSELSLKENNQKKYDEDEFKFDDDCDDNSISSSLCQANLDQCRLNLTEKIELNIEQLFPLQDHTISYSEYSVIEDGLSNTGVEVATIMFDKLPETDFCSTTIYKGLKLSLWRFVNDTPLLDTFNDSISCVISHALNAVNWKEFGHILKNELSNKKKTWTLLPIKESSETILDIKDSYPSAILVIVNVRNSTVNYANLRKTGLSYDKEISLSITDCITNTMCRLRQCEAGKRYDLFMSRSDRHEVNIKKYIPVLSNSIAKILYFSQNPRIHEDFLNTVIDNTEDNKNKQVNDENILKISNCLQKIINNTYDKSN